MAVVIKSMTLSKNVISPGESATLTIVAVADSGASTPISIHIVAGSDVIDGTLNFTKGAAALVFTATCADPKVVITPTATAGVFTVTVNP